MAYIIKDIQKMNLDTNTEQGELNNLILNLAGGLDPANLSIEERNLLEKFGYSLKSWEINNDEA